MSDEPSSVHAKSLQFVPSSQVPLASHSASNNDKQPKQNFTLIFFIPLCFRPSHPKTQKYSHPNLPSRWYSSPNTPPRPASFSRCGAATPAGGGGRLAIHSPPLGEAGNGFLSRWPVGAAHKASSASSWLFSGRPWAVPGRPPRRCGAVTAASRRRGPAVWCSAVRLGSAGPFSA